MKNKVIFSTLILIILVFISCGGEKKKKIQSPLKTLEVKEKVKLNEDLENVDLAISANMLKETTGPFKLFVLDDKLYYVCNNPKEKDKLDRFFLHVNLENGEKLNLDFQYSKYEVEGIEESKYKEYAIAFRKLPLDDIFSILTGQFDETGRTWSKVLHKNDILNLN